jgi:hypothetical protein
VIPDSIYNHKRNVETEILFQQKAKERAEKEAEATFLISGAILLIVNSSDCYME